MTGALHIVRSTGRSGDVYSVVFAPTGGGGALKPKEFGDVESLRAFLKSMRIDDPSIQNALKHLDVRGNATVPIVELSPKGLAELGLK
jgi:hypothetical protein